MIGRNSVQSGQYKSVNYTDDSRGNNKNGVNGFDSTWDKQFTEYSELLKRETPNNDKFSPFDESGDKYHADKQDPNRKLKEKPEDLFDTSKLLPNETRKDWFEILPDPISVKNRNLINVTRPIGINTINTTLKNPSLDIRAAPPCPKFVVSPFLNSSIEPDINIKPIL
jgi:hypothetical protein